MFSIFGVRRLRVSQRKWPEEKLPVGLESIRNFNVRAKVVGPSVSDWDCRRTLDVADARLIGCFRKIHPARDADEGPDQGHWLWFCGSGDRERSRRADVHSRHVRAPPILCTVPPELTDDGTLVVQMNNRSHVRKLSLRICWKSSMPSTRRSRLSSSSNKWNSIKHSSSTPPTVPTYV